MIQVYVISEEQALALKGKMYDDSSYFNPIKNKNGDWVVSYVEVNNCCCKYLNSVVKGIKQNIIPVSTEGMFEMEGE